MTHTVVLQHCSWEWEMISRLRRDPFPKRIKRREKGTLDSRALVSMAFRLLEDGVVALAQVRGVRSRDDTLF